MSRVFVAEETALGRKVVVKVLPPEYAAGLNVDRFRREIRVAAGLHHPHIVPLLAAGQAGDVLYYTMPLIEGESLRARIASRGELPVHDTVRLLKDVVDGLAFAHQHGVMHRDIKPDNVLISGKHALVTDFGVAKALEASGKSSITSTGLALGTPALHGARAGRRGSSYRPSRRPLRRRCARLRDADREPAIHRALRSIRADRARHQGTSTGDRGSIHGPSRPGQHRDALPREEAGRSLSERGRTPEPARSWRPLRVEEPRRPVRHRQ